MKIPLGRPHCIHVSNTLEDNFKAADLKRLGVQYRNMGKELHAIWDTALVVLADGGSDDPAGEIINQFSAQQKSAIQQILDPGQIAAESLQIASTATPSRSSHAGAVQKSVNGPDCLAASETPAENIDKPGTTSRSTANSSVSNRPPWFASIAGYYAGL